MTMYYYEPKTFQEACDLLNKHQDDAKLIAGGQSLMVLLRQKVVVPGHLVNLKSIKEGAYIKEEGGELKIGALTTHRQIETSPLVREKLPVLAEVFTGIGSVQVRNWGTIGGNLAHSDPAGDLAPLLIALGAKVRVISQSHSAEMPLETFITGYLETKLTVSEMLQEIVVPLPSVKAGMAYEKEAVRAGDMALASAAALIEMGSQGITRAVVVVAAVGEMPIRLNTLEKELQGQGGKGDLEIDPHFDQSIIRLDPYVSKEYKYEIARIKLRNVIQTAFRRAKQA
ncbi:xanthine dehydrogenase family protein subunit M [Paradesulfitobacterium aromaticivorans]